MLEALKHWAEGVVQTMGYPGIFLLMMLDAMNIPIPSEAIMPMAGILAVQGKMNVGWGIVAGSLGSIVGSLLSYGIGAKLGKPFLLKYGRFFFMSPKEVAKSERWFERHGLFATLWGRCVPLVRTFVSLPAGLFRAPLGLFTLYAVIGSFVWNTLWALLGFYLERHWDTVKQYSKFADVVVISLALIVIVRFVIYKRRERHHPSEEA